MYLAVSLFVITAITESYIIDRSKSKRTENKKRLEPDRPCRACGVFKAAHYTAGKRQSRCGDTISAKSVECTGL